MKRCFTTVLLALWCLAMVCAGATEYVAGEILIRFKELVTIEQRMAFEQQEQLTFIHEIPTVHVRLYRLPDRTTVNAAVERYQRHPLIEFAEPNFARQLGATIDPDLSRQWALENTGQIVNGHSGPAAIDIRMPGIARIWTPISAPVVAVIDSGVAIDHPELFDHTWINEVEFDGRDNFDDDKNGYIDDIFGYDFYTGWPWPGDENGHGTLIAAIIAGSAGNGLGGMGVCPVARIMPLRVLSQFGRGGIPKYARVSDVALALGYALRNGAQIANLSFGGSAYSATEYAMCQTLASSNVLIVAASGNGGEDGAGDNNDTTPFYPASYNLPNVIAVAAQDRSGGLAYFSNYGPRTVHIAAPGTDIYGADITRRTFFAENFDGGAPGWTVGYAFGNGASRPWLIDQLEGNHFLASNPLGTRYEPYTNEWAASPAVLLDGVHGSRLSFNLVYDLGDDWLIVEASSNGVVWAPYDYISGSMALGETNYEHDVDISDYDGSRAYFRFRLSSDSSVQGMGAFIDDISVTGVTVFDPSAPRFRFDSGTSFAAPIVSGVAALVMSQRPDLTAVQVKSILLNSGRRLPGLTGKVLCGGMVDAEAALVMASTYGMSAPQISKQPQATSVPSGTTVTFTVGATGTPAPTFQWRKNGANISGATTATLTIPNARSADAGDYTCVVTNPAGAVTSAAGTLTISGPAGRLTNLSVRASLAANQNLIVGFATDGAKNVLIRAIGPTLATYGVSGTCPDPRLGLYNSNSVLVQNNDDWGGGSSLRDAFTATGAFQLATNSKDAALLRTTDGLHSAIVNGSGSGVTLVEVYDAEAANPHRLINVSARNFVGTNDSVLIAGFAIDGSTPKQLLIRACGAKLAAYGISGTLADPKLEIFDQNHTRVAVNNNWSDNVAERAALQAAFTQTNAFSFDLGSKDAALLVTLPAGQYSAVVSGSDGGTGEALVEVYEMP